MVDLNFDEFIQNPTCLWDMETTKRLVEIKWSAWISAGLLSNPTEYSSAAIVSRKFELVSNRLQIEIDSPLKTYIEGFSEEHLGNFYLENGLVPLGSEEIISAKTKLEKALSLFDYSDGPLKSINLLIRSIHVVKQDDPEIDVSHSDPDIPFSIFLSVCKDITPISNIRVAESILHEAMHLKLTLLESIIPLVEFDIFETFYSPWRGVKRPVRGVLHGLFVFRSIVDFFKENEFIGCDDAKVRNYLDRRTAQITSEFEHLKDFHSSKGLTQSGANLVRNLLPLN